MFTYIRERLLPNLPSNALIVMDNASYHSRQDDIERVPTTNTRKSEMHTWLNNHGT